MTDSIPRAIYRVIQGEMSESISFGWGRREIAEFANPPRIVGIPLGAPRIVPSKQVGYQDFEDDTGPYKDRRIVDRLFEILFYVHNTTEDGTEALYLDLLRVVRKKYHNGVQFAAETWIDQAEGADGFAKFGNAISFVATFESPVFERRRDLQLITGFQTDCDTMED